MASRTPATASRQRVASRAAVAALSLGMLLAPPGGAAARAERTVEGAKRVAVVVATRVNVGDDEARRIAAGLAAEVERHLLVRAIAAEVGAPADCVGKPRCLAELGATVDADDLLLLALVRLGGSLRVEVTWADPATGRAAVRAPLVFEGQRREAVVGAGDAAMLLPHAARRRGPSGGEGEMLLAPIIAATAGAAALAGSVAYGHRARRGSGAPGGGCGQRCVEERVARDTARAGFLLGTAIAAGVTGGVLYLRGRDRRASRVTIGAGPAAGGGVIVWGGEF